MGDIVPCIYDGDHLNDDLNILRNNPATKRDVALLTAFLDEVASSEDARWQLLRRSAENFVSPYFNCRAIECFQDDGFNLYRLRPLRSRLQKYRIIYAFDTTDASLHLLAVVVAVKDLNPPPPPELHYDYAKNHHISQRIRDEYLRQEFAEL